MAELSTKPYLIRAIHQWCEDSGFRPYLAVMVDERTVVPREFVRNGEIVLNVSAVATHRLQIGNDLIEFEARFSGAVRQVSIPIENVSAIYAQETGHGMAFDVPKPLALAPDRSQPSKDASEAAAASKPASRPKLVPKSAEGSPSSAVGDSTDLSASRGSGAVKPSGPDSSPLGAVDATPAAGSTREPGTRGRRRPRLSAVPDQRAPESDPVGASADAESARSPETPKPALRTVMPSETAQSSGLAQDSEGERSKGLIDSSTNSGERSLTEGSAGAPGVQAETASEPPSPDEPPPAPSPARPQLKRVK